MTDRFLHELRAALKDSKTEGRAMYLIGAMRFVQLKVYPMDRIAETADFLKECGECFQEAHSLRLKHAFAELFAELLAPVAEVRWTSWLGRDSERDGGGGGGGAGAAGQIRWARYR